MEFISEPDLFGSIIFIVYAMVASTLSGIWDARRPVLTNGLIEEKGRVWVFWYHVQSWAVPSALIISTIVMMEFVHDLPMFHFLQF